MAKGSNHIVAGICIGLCGLYFFQLQNSSVDCLICFFASIAGSLFPDIDIKSKGQKLFYGIMAPFYIFLFAQGQWALCFLVGLSALFPLLCNHRGLYHSLWFIVGFVGLWSAAMVALFPLYSNQIVIGSLFFICGALSHLWLDFGLKKCLCIKSCDDELFYGNLNRA